MRPMGEILYDMEELIGEMTDDHDLQWGDILNLVYGYLEVHCPEAQEIYEDDGSGPVFYYGPEEE